MADMIKIVAATGRSRDGVTGQLIPAGTIVAHVTFNTRCAPFLTRESLERLGVEIDKGVGMLFRSVGPADNERWREHGWRHQQEQRRLQRDQA